MGSFIGLLKVTVTKPPLTDHSGSCKLHSLHFSIIRPIPDPQFSWKVVLNNTSAIIGL